MKHTFITRILSAIFPYKVIENCYHNPYLVRWYVFRTKRVSLFIHKFIRSDEDRALHDHPWAFLVVPIWRGYIEHSEYVLQVIKMGMHALPVRRRVYPIIGTRYRSATYRHRVELMKAEECHPIQIQELPAWSLFFHFKREREWGFHPPTGFVHWRDWWTTNCE